MEVAYFVDLAVATLAEKSFVLPLEIVAERELVFGIHIV